MTVDPVFAMAAVAASIALLAGVGVVAERHRRRTLERSFRELARRLDGQVVTRSGARPSGTTLAVEALVEDVVVCVDVYAVGNGRSRRFVTRALAEHAMPSGPRFEVSREDVFSTIRKRLGMEDIVLGGDARFDEEFVVRTEDAEATAEAWTGRAKTAMLGLAGATALSDGHTVRIEWPNPTCAVDELERAARLVAELAGYGLSLLRDLAEMLPEARFLPPRAEAGAWSPPAVEVQVTAGTARVVPAVLAGWPTLRLSLPCARALAPFKGRISGGRLLDEPTALALPPTAPAELAAIDVGVLGVRPGKLTVDFPSPGPDIHERVGAGIRLLSGIAGASAARGAFR